MTKRERCVLQPSRANRNNMVLGRVLLTRAAIAPVVRRGAITYYHVLFIIRPGLFLVSNYACRHHARLQAAYIFSY